MSFPGTEGIDHPLPPLIYCPHIFQVQNYSFLHLYRQFKQDLSIHLPWLGSSLRGASFSLIGHVPYSSSNPSLSFDSNPIPPNFSVFSTESGVVQDLSSRSTAQSATSTADRLVRAFWVQFFIHRLFSVQSYDFLQWQFSIRCSKIL